MQSCGKQSSNKPRIYYQRGEFKVMKKMTFERKKHSIYNFFFYTRSRFDLKKIDTENKNINMNINLRLFLSKEFSINLLVDLNKNINLSEEFKTNF